MSRVFPANAYCSGTSKRISRIRSGARTVSSRCRMSGPTLEFVNGHESFLALTNRGALSILDARFKFARASYLFSREPWSAVRLEQELLVESCVFSAVSRVFAGLTSASVRMHQTRGVTIAVREGCRACLGGWSRLRTDRVPEELQVHPCQVACASLHRARGRSGVSQLGRGCDVACPEKESRGLPGGVVATSGSL